jgi:hypothetical protein
MDEPISIEMGWGFFQFYNNPFKIYRWQGINLMIQDYKNYSVVYTIYIQLL